MEEMNDHGDVPAEAFYINGAQGAGHGNYEWINHALADGAVRFQQDDTCVFNAIAYMVERQKKATVINVQSFFNNYKKKLKVPFPHDQNRVITALEMFQDQGVIAICNGREERVKISGYECYRRMNEHQVFAMIDSGIPLMGTFAVREDFWYLEDKVYELTPHRDGDDATHIVMFVGYGMKDGRHYLVFLNSYGLSWGTRGLGRVYFDQVFQMDDKGFQFIGVIVDGHNNAPTPHHERAFRPDQMQSCGYMSLAGQRSAPGKGGCSTVCTNARAERTSKSMAFPLSKTLLPKFKHINQEEKAFAHQDGSGTACGADPGKKTR